MSHHQPHSERVGRKLCEGWEGCCNLDFLIGYKVRSCAATLGCSSHPPSYIVPTSTLTLTHPCTRRSGRPPTRASPFLLAAARAAIRPSIPLCLTTSSTGWVCTEWGGDGRGEGRRGSQTCPSFLTTTSSTLCALRGGDLGRIKVWALFNPLSPRTSSPRHACPAEQPRETRQEARRRADENNQHRYPS